MGRLVLVGRGVFYVQNRLKVKKTNLACPATPMDIGLQGSQKINALIFLCPNC